MAKVNNLYLYFSKLERELSMAWSGFLCLLIIFSSVIIVGLDRIIQFANTMSPEIVMLSGIGMVGFLSTVMFLSGKFGMVGNIHIWIDTHIFGFLKESNKVILRSLLMALKPEERSQAERFSPDEQDSFAQSVFASLSNDAQVFDILVNKKIFRTWISYWTVVYSALMCSILTVIAFATVLMSSDAYARILFTVLWIFALTQFGAAVLLGRRLIRVSEKVIEAIIESHKHQIIQLLRQELFNAQMDNVEE